MSPEATATLRDALRAWLNGNAPDDAALGAAIRTVAAEARDRRIRAEELLVTLKTTWFDVGGAASTPHAAPSDNRRLDELVTACIKAYYG